MKRALTCILLGGLLALVWFSHHLAGIRIYHPDECQNVFMAGVIAAGQVESFYAEVGLFQWGLLSWLARHAAGSVDMFVAGRAVMVEVFWLNLLLIVLATGERLLSLRGLVALIGAATTVPLWDYGFEVRPDNVLLSGILLTWCIVRGRPPGWLAFLLLGALAVVLEFIAFKAVLYMVPLSLAALASAPVSGRRPRVTLALSWVAGALGTLLLMRWIYGVAGFWNVYLADFRWACARIGEWNLVAHCKVLARLLSQTPLLLAVVAAALVSVVVDVQRRGKAAMGWGGCFPEAMLFLGALLVLLASPALHPPDLLNLVPYAFLFAFRYAALHWDEIWGHSVLRPAVVGVLVFAHFVPFAAASRRYLYFTNFHQEAWMRLAEEFTDPAKDPLYDGIGLVPTRPSSHFWWLLPDSNQPGCAEEHGLQVRDFLAARPAAVVIPNFRSDLLPEADQAFIRQRYVSLADDFWVLGKVLPPGGGVFEAVHPGRYRISTLEGSDLAGTYPGGLAGLMAPLDEGTIGGTLDGVPLSKCPMELKVGTHRIQTKPDCVPAVVWMGPRRDRASRLGDSGHQFLFTDRY